MILVLGGTTEGRIAVQTLEEAGKPFYYSTKGNEQEVPLHNGIRLQGGMDKDSLESFCRKENISLLIDAAHPFAEELHRNVSETADILQIPVIRYERIYPRIENNEGIVWCDNYEDAIRQIKKEEVYIILALTGVNSISKLKALWMESSRCYFRILDRESSRESARNQGFPEEYLRYYHTGEDERLLMQQIRPEAVILKESGASGGFSEKLKAAQELGIRIFVIKRPPLYPNFLSVNGKYGLRRTVEQYYPGFYPLRSGLTTGTCAAAAAAAAIWDIFNIQGTPRPPEFAVILPNGELIDVPVEPQQRYPRSSSINNNWIVESEASVIKDAGDDPDITNGMRIKADIILPIDIDENNDETSQKDFNIIIAGGEGIGIVTMPGLGLELGAPAINPTPRKMIEDNVRMYLDYVGMPKMSDPIVVTISVPGGEGIGIVTMPGLGLELGAPAINPTPRKMIEDNVRMYLDYVGMPKMSDPIVVTISVPGGEEIAKRTFNPRLGIEGGISIIGTSGIVKPFSSEAFISSIRKSMEVACATGSPRIVISSGAKSERYIKAYYPELPAQAFVHYGNFIGETLKIADKLKLPRVTLGVMIGKAVKLAEGHLDTHSKKVTMNKEFIQDIAHRTGCNEDVLTAIRNMNLARELWDIIPAEKLETFSKLLTEHCKQCCAPLLPDGELTILLISEDGKIYV